MLDVVDVHVGGGDTWHAASALHAVPPPVHSLTVLVEHDIPLAQSESVAHDPSAHVMVVTGSHGGTGGHSSPFAHAGAFGHSVVPVATHENPWPQSASVEHSVAALASAVARSIAPVRAAKARQENTRE